MLFVNINVFQLNILFLYPLKTKHLWFSVVFRGYGKGTFAWWELWEGIPDKTWNTPTWQLSLTTLGLYLDLPLDSANGIWFWNIATEIKLSSKKLLRSTSMTKFPIEIYQHDKVPHWDLPAWQSSILRSTSMKKFYIEIYQHDKVLYWDLPAWQSSPVPAFLNPRN